MTQEERIKLSALQVEIMDEIHTLCEKHQVVYYMIAGTLLGAVRHGGYIPWDIDIDIALPRKEYERFKEVCLTELNEKYIYVDLSVDSKYSKPHAVIARKNTRVQLKYDHMNLKRRDWGIFVDIFPLDNAPEDHELRTKQAKQLLLLQRLKYYRIPYAYSKKKWRRNAHYVVSLLLSWIPIKTINKIQQAIMQKYASESTSHICTMASGYSYRQECMPREIYGEPVLLSFEGRMYNAPAKYKEYLERIYGDYMKIPPLEKRVKSLETFASVEFDVEQTDGLKGK